MPRVDFDQLPDHGRIWVFPSRRALSDKERGALLAEVDAFLDGWAAHGHPLRSGRAFLERHFLVVGVDEDASQPSGCSIDALVNRLEVLGDTLGTRLVDHAPVWYRVDGEVLTATREEFRELARGGKVDSSTPVFDTTVVRLSDFRRVGLERPGRDSWHGRAFFRDRSEG